MRLQLTLEEINDGLLAANYFSSLSAAIYKLMKFDSLAFSAYLRGKGYKPKTCKYRNFTFALKLRQPVINKNIITIHNRNARLFISLPLIDDFIENSVLYSLKSKLIKVNGGDLNTVFRINSLELLPKTEFFRKMKFLCLSPIVLSTKISYNGKLIPYYYRYYDGISEINDALNYSLIKKYKSIYNISPNNKMIRMEWDKDYIQLCESKNRKILHKQKIKEQPDGQAYVIGNFIPFTVTGDIELIKTGFETGFGNLNSLGFGMVDVVKPKTNNQMIPGQK